MHEGGAGAAKRPQIARGGRQGHIVGHAQSWRPRRAAFEAIALVKLELRPGRGPRIEVVEEITAKDQQIGFRLVIAGKAPDLIQRRIVPLAQPVTLAACSTV